MEVTAAELFAGNVRVSLDEPANRVATILKIKETILSVSSFLEWQRLPVLVHAFRVYFPEGIIRHSRWNEEALLIGGPIYHIENDVVEALLLSPSGQLYQWASVVRGSLHNERTTRPMSERYAYTATSITIAPVNDLEDLLSHPQTARLIANSARLTANLMDAMRARVNGLMDPATETAHRMADMVYTTTPDSSE